MNQITEWVANAAVWAKVFLATTVLVTVVVCAGAALMIFVLSRGVLWKERWATLLGWSFIILALQYFSKMLVIWQNVWALERFPSLIAGAQFTAKWGHPVLSPLNNLILLAAASELLRWPVREMPKVLSHRGGWLKLIPWWVYLAAALSVVAVKFGPLEFWRRLPDASFSAISLAILAHAVYANVEPNRKTIVPKAFLWGLYAYALINFLFAFSPLVAEGKIWSSLRTTTLNALNGWAESRPDLRSTLLVMRPDVNPPSPDDDASVSEALDASAYVLALFFKLVLFGGILRLMRRSLIALTPRQDKPGGKLTRLPENQGYLSDQGIVMDLARRMGADYAAIHCLLPGSTLERTVVWRWPRNPSSEPGERRERSRRKDYLWRVLPQEESVVSRVLFGGEPEWSLDRMKEPRYQKGFIEDVPGSQSFATLPIRHHDSVIGCIDLEWKEKRAFTATALTELKESAELLSPVLQAQRELGAVHSLIGRLRDLAATQNSLNNDALANILFYLFEFLAPAGAALHLDYGFRRRSVLIRNQESPSKILPEEMDAERFSAEFLKHLRSGGHHRPVILSEALLEGEVLIGRLELAAAKGRGPGEAAGVVSNALVRKTVGLLVTDTVRRVARRELYAAINLLAKDLKLPEALSHSGIYEAVEKVTGSVGIQAVSLESGSTDPAEKPPGGKVGALLDRSQWQSRKERRFAEGGSLAGVFALQEPRDATLLLLNLARGDWRLWILVARPGFGAEVEDSSSPWCQFLEDLASAASAPLLRLERERLRYEAEEQRAMALRIAMSSFAIHDVGNWALKLGAGLEGVRSAQDLREAIGRAHELEDLTDQIATSAASLREPNVGSSARVLSLRGALEELKRKHEAGLGADDIALLLPMPPDLTLTLPQHGFLLVLDNLIANARREILRGREQGHRGGEIRISAREEAGSAIVEVEDDGPGVPPEKIPTLFHPGQRNMGLPISSWVLHLHKADLALAEGSRPGATKFILNIGIQPQR